MNYKQIIQELITMISRDKTPMMDGSHRLDHHRANKLLVELRNQHDNQVEQESPALDYVDEQLQEALGIKPNHLRRAVIELVTALRDLHDLQNGPPLERDRDEWAAVMVRVIELLEKYEV